MASELVINTDRVQKFIHDLEAQKNILSTCTQLFTTISKRFTSLQDSLSQKSQSLESRIQALETTFRETLESLNHRESSIHERESAVVGRVKEQKEAALAQFEKPLSGNEELSETLKSFSRKMDSSGLLKFIISKRKESVTLRGAIAHSIAEAVDPPKLVLDTLEQFVSAKSAKVGVTDKRWACGMLIQALFPEVALGGKTEPKFARSVVENAARILELWKGQMDNDTGIGALGPAEAVMFLQMVVGFRLQARFDEGFLRKLVVEYASRRDMAKLAAALKFGEKLGDIIDELVKSGKEIEAVYFASESGLTERFSPVSLLKSYLRNSKKNATTILKNGNNSVAATEESSNVELSSIKTIIKCVEDHKLESEFSLESLHKRISHLEKTKAERKKSSVAAASNKPQNKRAYGGNDRGNGAPFRGAKAAKSSNAHSSFNRRNPIVPPRSPAARYPPGPYNYPNQSIYSVPASTQYGSSYGVPHIQSPVGIPPQHYSLPVENIGSSGFRVSGSYGGQTSYGAYDHSNTVPPNYQV